MRTLRILLFPAIIVLFFAFVGGVMAANTVSVSPASYSPNESSGQVGVIVKVTRDAGNQQTVTVNFATADGTAQVGSDYFAAAGTLTFGPSETTKLVQVLDY